MEIDNFTPSHTHELLSLFLSNSSDLIYSLTYDLVEKANYSVKIQCLNPSILYTALGYISHQNSQQPTSLIPLIHPEDYKYLSEHTDNLSNPCKEGRQLRLKHQAKHWVHFTVQKSLIKHSKDEQELQVFAIAKNTSITQELEKVKKEKELITSILENIPEFILVKNASDLKITWCNKASETLIGHSKEDLIGKTSHDLFPEEQASMFDQQDHKLLTGEQQVDITEGPINTLHKGKIIIRAKKILLKNKYDIPQYLIGISQDITKEQLAKKKLLHSEQRFRFLAEYTHDLICLHYLNGNLAYVSPSIKPLLGYQQQELLNTNPYQLLHPHDKKKLIAIYQESLSNHQNTDKLSFIYRIKRKDGVYIWFDTIATPVRDDKGKLVQFLTTSRDISLQKQIEFELIQQKNIIEEKNKKLKTSNQDLEEFAYIASHDLQEPLRMVISYIKLIERKYGELFDEKGKKYLYFAADGAVRMKNLINDLLELSRVNTKKKRLEIIDLYHIIEVVKKVFSGQIQEKNVQIHYPYLPSIKGDRFQIEQLFINLVGNAIKYNLSEKPCIEITATESVEFVTFSVKDNGIGIDMQFQEKVFQVFRRLHAPNEYSGTGIGLSICKKIVERHEGKIWLESTQGKGSSFFFTIKK